MTEAEIDEGHAHGLRQMARDDEVRRQELAGRLERLGALIELLRAKGVERMDFPADLACVTGYVGGAISVVLHSDGRWQCRACGSTEKAP